MIIGLFPRGGHAVNLEAYGPLCLPEFDTNATVCSPEINRQDYYLSRPRRAQLASISWTSFRKSSLSRLLRMKSSRAALRLSLLCSAYIFSWFSASSEKNEFGSQLVRSLSGDGVEYVSGDAAGPWFRESLLTGVRGRAAGRNIRDPGDASGEDEFREKLLWPSVGTGVCGSLE